MTTKIKIINIENKYNIQDENDKLLYDELFDQVFNFRNDYAMCTLNNKYNFIDAYGKVISPIWFDCVRNFISNRAGVFLYDKGFNFIDESGIIISDTWFDLALDFNGTKTKVKLKDKNQHKSLNEQRNSVVHWIQMNDFKQRSLTDYSYMNIDEILYPNYFKEETGWVELNNTGDIIYSN